MSATRIARKAHACTLCGEEIPVGGRHAYRRTTPWDHEANDSFFDYRAHEPCHGHWLHTYGADHDWEFPIGAEADFRASRDAHPRRLP